MVYLIAGPFLAAFVGVFTGGLIFGICNAGLRFSESISTTVALIPASLLAVATLWFAIRDFQRRAFAELIVDGQGVQVRQGRRSSGCSIDGLDGVRLARGGTQFVFSVRNGRTIRVPVDLVRAADVMPDVERLLLAPLTNRVAADLEAGGVVHIKDRGWLGLAVGTSGSVLLIAGGALALPTLHFTAQGIGLIARGITGWRQSWRGFRGGFELTREGLRDTRGGAVYRWDQPLTVRSDVAGIVVQADVGPPLQASPYASHFCEARVLILARTSSGVSRAGEQVGRTREPSLRG